MLREGLLVSHLLSFFDFCIISLTMKFQHVGYHCGYASTGLEMCVFKFGHLVSKIMKSLCLEEKHVHCKA